MSKNKENIVNINKIQNKQSNTDKIEKSIKGADVLIFNNVCAVALKHEYKAPSVVYKSQDVLKSKLAANNVSLPVYKHNVASDIALIMN